MATPEVTFHLIGEDPHILSNGEPSVVVRSDSNQLKIDLYKGLYHVVTDSKWLFCVYGCPNRDPANPIAMSTDPRIKTKSTTCIGNFIKHLNIYHPSYLSKVDIAANTFKVDLKKRKAGISFFAPIGKKCHTSDINVNNIMHQQCRS